MYVADVQRSAEYYGRIFGFRVISDFGSRGCALEAGPRQVLLLFKQGASAGSASPPAHDGAGELHLAFAIVAAELDKWEQWLAGNGITVEERTQWPMGGQSLYFRDPDRNLLEVVTPGTWSIY